ncbi:acetyl-CoA C-acyltransferase [Dyella japonica]|uniref:acetyl-CoA C-acyltransferase n=1 Tax=Dyella japonica TaxID=231455 RepID=UPI00190F24BC|nr:acetyl-CoA C-acyltransferase [Dyella japonica]
MDPIVIVSAVRTPLGRFQGALSSLPGHALGTAAIRAAIERAGVAPDAVDEVLMGCVLPAGQGQAPARQAAIGAGIPTSVGATTVNKVCGSGMKATMLAHDLLRAGSAEVIVAGGMESMSGAPYLLTKARGGYRVGHEQIFDHMMLDGLEDAYEKGRPMGDFGEMAAERYGFGRDAQDAWAVDTLQRAQRAIGNGDFVDEIVPVEVRERAGTVLVDRDEHPQRVSPEKIPTLKPAFRSDGTITAASASANADGAAALVLTRQSTAQREGWPILAVIRGHATHSQEPAWYTTAPAPAIRRLLGRLDWSLDSVGLFEINEAFAVVPMIAAKELGIPRERINIHGGACALGHPIGATGARLIVTLVHAMRHTGTKRGVASLCIGGGEATAVALELPEEATA